MLDEMIWEEKEDTAIEDLMIEVNLAYRIQYHYHIYDAMKLKICFEIYELI